ncbi:MAG: hypothetical protein ACJAZP_003129 [Psychromonas sp.]|jgi:uncharacterized protein YaiE (UPF0345 family)
MAYKGNKMSFQSNEYFDGNVKSIAFQSETLPATLGVMNIGEYTFGTDAYEFMTVVSGALTVKLPGATDWKTFNAGETFEVEANVSFDVKVKVQTAYLCLYKK